MWDIISAIATIPILIFIIVYFGYGFFIKDRKRAIRMAMDVSTLFFILNVGALINYLFDITSGLYGILLVMIIGVGLLGNIYYRKDGAIPWKRIARVVWRVAFFVMVLLYVVLNIFVFLRLAITV